MVVVGAGPAGLMAAIAAAEQGARATVLEQLPAPGAKLLATGGGRCNLTNTLAAEAFMARFGRHGRFMQPALEAMDSTSLRAFFDSLGVPTHCPDGQAVFPKSNRAADVLAALLGRCRSLGVTVRTGCAVTGLEAPGQAIRAVVTDGEVFPAGAVILATGGRSYPELGATGVGYELAGRYGHRIVPPTPALAPLVTREDWPGRCAGVSLSPARVWIDLPGQSRQGQTGDVLLTHRGLSGPAVLNLSADVAVLLSRRPEGVPLRLDLTPGVSAGQWRQRIDRWQQTAGRRSLRALTAEHVPAAVAAVLCELAGIGPDLPAAHAPAEARQALAALLTAAPLTAVDTEGFAKAIVTRGGVALKDVRPDTMESRLVSGLHFAGELLDLDGPCGGFNLQWAFSSGYLAGRSAGLRSSGGC